jgi:peptide/nickel transport system ATP-binding protein
MPHETPWTCDSSGSVEPQDSNLEEDGSLLQVTNLRTQIQSGGETTVPVDGVSLSVGSGQIVGLVGESGCGKSMTALSVMGLMPPGASIVGGSIKLDGRELVGLSEKDLCTVRGQDIGMIFQDPMTSLNPTKTVGKQISESLRLHGGLSRKSARARAEDLIRSVGLAQPSRAYESYPHQFSGGMRQRIMIAIALVSEPKLLIADEPTTALDVTVQAQILSLLQDLHETHQMAILLITHDFGVVASIADRVEVMYAGQIVEGADIGELYGHPRHPYSAALLAACPSLRGPQVRRLQSIKGLPPSLSKHFTGCRFAPRCNRATAECRTSAPELESSSADHGFRCIHPM